MNRVAVLGTLVFCLPKPWTSLCTYNIATVSRLYCVFLLSMLADRAMSDGPLDEDTVNEQLNRMFATVVSEWKEAEEVGFAPDPQDAPVSNTHTVRCNHMLH